jgi:hypothetical protein
MNNAGQNFYAKAALCGLAFVPWFIVLCFQVTNFDAAWLTTCGERLLGGQRLSEGCFETNPPLSVLIYLIPALLEKFAGVPKSFGLPLYDFVLIGLSALAVNAILRAQNILTDPQRRVLLFAWLLANTVMTAQWFGERDQIVLLGLFPFVLVQLGITSRLTLPPRLKWAVLIMGSLAILIKPHYALIPALVFLHRGWKQKRWSVFADNDFSALAWTSAAYAALVLFAFNDWVKIILPDSLRFYALQPYHAHTVWPTALASAVLIPALMALVFLRLKDARRDMPLLLLTLALLCVIVYALQNKGFMYQFIPVKAFIFCGLALPLIYLFKNRAALKACLLLTLAAYLSTPPNFAIPTPQDFRDYTITREAGIGGPGCTFFLFGDIADVQNVAHYAGCGLASRFSELWFLEPLLTEKYNAAHNLPHRLTAAQTDSEMRKYAALVTADFKHYRPETVILARVPVAGDPNFEFAGFFAAQDPEFAALWKNYHFVKEITARSPYYGYLDYTGPNGARRINYGLYRKTGN